MGHSSSPSSLPRVWNFGRFEPEASRNWLRDGDGETGEKGAAEGIVGNGSPSAASVAEGEELSQAGPDGIGMTESCHYHASNSARRVSPCTSDSSQQGVDLVDVEADKSVSYAGSAVDDASEEGEMVPSASASVMSISSSDAGYPQTFDDLSELQAGGQQAASEDQPGTRQGKTAHRQGRAEDRPAQKTKLSLSGCNFFYLPNLHVASCLQHPYLAVCGKSCIPLLLRIPLLNIA